MREKKEEQKKKKKPTRRDLSALAISSFSKKKKV